MPTNSKSNKAPAKVEPKPAPTDFIAPLSARGKAVGRTLTQVTGRSGDEYGKGLVELWNIEGQQLTESTGYYVEARQPFASPIMENTLVVMSEGYVIESVMFPMNV